MVMLYIANDDTAKAIKRVRVCARARARLCVVFLFMYYAILPNCILQNWFAGSHIFKGLFEDLDLVLRLELELGLGSDSVSFSDQGPSNKRTT